MENKNPKDYVYIAKKDTWYKEGTEAMLIGDISGNSGLFRGVKEVRADDHPNLLSRHEVGEEFIDEELCGYDEFDIYEK